MRLNRGNYKRQRKHLYALTDATVRYLGALDRHDEEGKTLYWSELRFAKAAAQSEGCSEGQLRRALREAGVVDPREEHKKREYLESIAAGLPDDLAAIVRGGT